MGIEDIGIRMRINRLNGIRDDLNDDDNSIRTINSRINDVIEDVQSFIQVGSAPITSKLENLKEPFQSGDSYIINARSCVKNEINYLNRQLED